VGNPLLTVLESKREISRVAPLEERMCSSKNKKNMKCKRCHVRKLILLKNIVNMGSGTGFMN
jgi:hypothetical protein